MVCTVPVKEYITEGGIWLGHSKHLVFINLRVNMVEPLMPFFPQQIISVMQILTVYTVLFTQC